MQIVPAETVSLNFMLLRQQDLYAPNVSVLLSLHNDNIAWKQLNGPSVELDNCFHLSTKFEMAPSMAFELFGEAFKLWSQKQRSPFATASSATLKLTHGTFDTSSLKATPIIHKRKKVSVEVTTQVRRSTRSTRYAGFKPPLVSDTKKNKSKVKPRKTPGIAADEASTSGGGMTMTPLHLLALW